MYMLGTNYPIAYSFDYIQNGWQNSNDIRTLVYFFKGPVPADFSEIPEEWIKDPNLMSKNSVACAMMTMLTRPEKGINNKHEWVASRTYCDPKGNAYNPTLKRWMIGDCVMMAHRSHKGVDRFPELGVPGVDYNAGQDPAYVEYYKYYEDTVLRDMYNADMPYRWKTSRDNQMDHYNYQLTSSTGNNYPVVVEFVREESVDGFYLRQGGDGTASQYCVGSLTIEPWDDTLNEGAGDWGTPIVITLTQENGCRVHIDFGQTLTASKFRLTGGSDTSGGWYPSIFQFTSSVEPAEGKDPYDITWALVAYIGGNQGTHTPQDFPRFYHSYLNTMSTNVHTLGFPYLLCDVGEPGDDATIILNQSKNVEPFSQLHPLHMGLNFKDV